MSLRRMNEVAFKLHGTAERADALQLKIQTDRRRLLKLVARKQTVREAAKKLVEPTCGN